MANKKISIPQNPIYSRILFMLSKESLTSTDLASKLGKEQPPVFRQLKFLENKGYVIQDKKKKQYNKKLFSLNWNKIEEDFYNISTGFLKKIEYPPKIKEIEREIGRMDKSLRQKDPKKFIDKYGYRKTIAQIFKNPNFVNLLKYSFSYFQDNKDITLERIFLGIIKGIDENSEYKALLKIIDNKKFICDLEHININMRMRTPEHVIDLELQHKMGFPRKKILKEKFKK